MHSMNRQKISEKWPKFWIFWIQKCDYIYTVVISAFYYIAKDKTIVWQTLLLCVIAVIEKRRESKRKMAYQKPTNIDDFINLMAKADMRVKTQLAEDLVVYLDDQENSIISNDLGLLIDSLMPWLTGSHYKVIVIIHIINMWFIS